MGVTLVAGLTSVPLVAGSDDDLSLSASEAAAVRYLERVGEPPRVPPTEAGTALPAGVPTAPPAAGPPPVKVAVGPSATAPTTAVVAPGVSTAAAPRPVPAAVAAPAGGSPPPAPAQLALPAIDLATLLPGASVAAARVAPGRSQRGVASWFGAPAGTCAHLTLPFGTEVRVTRPATGAVTTCTVDDRGPTLETGRLIDLSTGTIAELVSTDAGLIDVLIEW